MRHFLAPSSYSGRPNDPRMRWFQSAIFSSIVLGACGGILIMQGAGSPEGWYHYFMPAIGGALIAIAGATAGRTSR